MTLLDWLSSNWIEVFGAITGVIYVFLEIRQNIWLWPVGIITSAVYIIVFFTSKFYADMSLQVYYLVISCAGWYWWLRGAGHRAQGTGQNSPFEGGEGDVKKGSGLRAQGAGQEGENRRVGERENWRRRDEGTKRLRDEGTKELRTKRRRDQGTKRLRD